MAKVPKLKLHLWQELVYFALIAIGPVVIALCEILNSHSTPFKITFTSVGSVLLVIIILRRFVLANTIKKLQDECVLLEHDYSIGVGNPDLAKHKWVTCNLIIYAYHAIVVTLSLILGYMFITALSEQLIQFRGAMLLILMFVLVAIVFKIICYIIYLKVGTHEN